MLALRTKDPALAELDNKIAAKLNSWRLYMKKAETDPYYLQFAESSYADMDSLLDLRIRNAAKRTQETAAR